MKNFVLFFIDAEYYTKNFDYEVSISYKEPDFYQSKYLKYRVNNYLPFEFPTKIPLGSKIENIILTEYMSEKSYQYTIYDVTEKIYLIFENNKKHPYFRINDNFEYYHDHKKYNRCVLF
uniref:Uncharacterized protein n=1 Tax=Borely moumouvirus TaxID=2712067 RepID=A0A6G6ABH1_9VIRU